MSKYSFYILSFTWGLIMTLCGGIVFLLLMLFGCKPKKNQYGWYIEIGKEWGGLSLGPFCFVYKSPSQYILNHEFGHAIQNCWFGPFMIFINLASGMRYWYRDYQVLVNYKKYSDLPNYDSIWFEGQATRLGNYYNELNSKRV